MSIINDPISDMLTRIRNAGNASHEYVSLPLSKVKEAIAKTLKAEGYITDYTIEGESVKKNLRIQLKYMHKQPVIHEIRRMSLPSCRLYVGMNDIPRICNGLGIVILSTSRGIMSHKSAKRHHLGGELLCSVV